FAILNHAAVDSGIPRESATQRIGISCIAFAAVHTEFCGYARAERGALPQYGAPGALGMSASPLKADMRELARICPVGANTRHRQHFDAGPKVSIIPPSLSVESVRTGSVA